MELDQDFKEFIGLLNEHEVNYLVIGGYAVNYHGYPRYTKDIDFWLWMTKPNIEKLLEAIRAFGFGELNLKVEDFMTPENIVQLGYEPYRIDLLVDVEGVDFEACFERRNEAKLDGTSVKFLSLQDLIIAKKKAGRLQDLADAEQLQKISDKSKEAKE
ncbi:nucleotidyltransferase [Neolewinella lacunae]|uniref:Nucleotidyltransferase n=1 Tax=Neolewinella lacunae TaxID=1517758 RepID=A0A923PEY3_9BACT|nr:nucleotidyltransferase [Neolewinella lacunae]MBC6992835.1 nucleotidyltransferase [Neolewinella lacunae]MDN3633862.1 nucleotidyltransferase [Neolewinella lacunae]